MNFYDELVCLKMSEINNNGILTALFFKTFKKYVRILHPCGNTPLKFKSPNGMQQRFKLTLFKIFHPVTFLMDPVSNSKVATLKFKQRVSCFILYLFLDARKLIARKSEIYRHANNT